MKDKYLVISYDSDEQQFFYDVVHGDSSDAVAERVLRLRDYCQDVDVMTLRELEEMTARIKASTDEQNEAWLKELEAEKVEREA